MSTVFAHGSVAIYAEQAAELLAEVRCRTRTQSVEFKSKDLLKPQNLLAVQWLLRKRPNRPAPPLACGYTATTSVGSDGTIRPTPFHHAGRTAT